MGSMFRYTSRPTVIVPVKPSATLPERDGVWAAICAAVLVLNTLSVEVVTLAKLVTLAL